MAEAVQATVARARFDRDLSNVTYEIYLLHPAALLIVAHFVGHLSKYRQMPAVVLPEELQG